MRRRITGEGPSRLPLALMLPVSIFAIRGGGEQDPAVMALGIFVGAALIFVAFLREQGVRTHLEFRDGVPYCPRCRRQVSYGRDECRSCGYRNRTYGSSRRLRGPTPHQDEEFKRRIVAPAVELVRTIRSWWELRAVRRTARHASYLARGVEPGPLAWYRVFPDWQQAIVLRVAFAAPVVVLIALLMR